MTIDRCPFCGHPGMEKLVEAEHLDAIYFIECGTCGGQGSHRDTPTAAIEWWNGNHLKQGVKEYLEDYLDEEEEIL